MLTAGKHSKRYIIQRGSSVSLPVSFGMTSSTYLLAGLCDETVSAFCRLVLMINGIYVALLGVHLQVSLGRRWRRCSALTYTEYIPRSKIREMSERENEALQYSTRYHLTIALHGTPNLYFASSNAHHDESSRFEESMYGKRTVDVRVTQPASVKADQGCQQTLKDTWYVGTA